MREYHKVWKDQKDHRIHTIAEKPGTCVIDFNGLAPSLKIKEIHDTQCCVPHGGTKGVLGTNSLAFAGYHRHSCF